MDEFTDILFKIGSTSGLICAIFLIMLFFSKNDFESTYNISWQEKKLTTFDVINGEF